MASSKPPYVLLFLSFLTSSPNRKRGEKDSPIEFLGREDLIAGTVEEVATENDENGGDLEGFFDNLIGEEEKDNGRVLSEDFDASLELFPTRISESLAGKLVESGKEKDKNGGDLEGFFDNLIGEEEKDNGRVLSEDFDASLELFPTRISETLAGKLVESGKEKDKNDGDVVGCYDNLIGQEEKDNGRVLSLDFDGCLQLFPTNILGLRAETKETPTRKFDESNKETLEKESCNRAEAKESLVQKLGFTRNEATFGERYESRGVENVEGKHLLVAEKDGSKEQVVKSDIVDLIGKLAEKAVDGVTGIFNRRDLELAKQDLPSAFEASNGNNYLLGRDEQEKCGRKASGVDAEGVKVVVGKIVKPFPMDVLREQILCRLPLRAQVKLQVVEKAWTGIVQGYDTLIVQSDSSNSLSFAGVDGCMCHVDYSHNLIELIGSTNGIVCLYQQNKESGHSEIALWNPLTKMTDTVRAPDRFLDVCWKDYIVGFGYDEVGKEFKVVAVPPDTMHWLHIDGEIFRSNSQSWMKYARLPGTSLDSHLPAATVNGCIYWPSDEKREILKFGSISEEFTFIPDITISHGRACDNMLVNIHDELGAITYEIEGEIGIYVFAENLKVWRHVYKVGPVEINQLLGYFRYGGGIVFRDVSDNILVYHPEKSEMMEFGMKGRLFIRCCPYTNSNLKTRGMK